jgi:hypothetical protein
MSDKVTKTVDISQDDQDFLKEYPEINFSGAVRQKLQELKKEKDWNE